MSGLSYTDGFRRGKILGRERLAVVGYFDTRTGKVECLEHGTKDAGSGSPWDAIREGDCWEHPDHPPAPIRCHDCGAWLEGEST